MALTLDHHISRRQFLRITAVSGITLAAGGGITMAMLRTADLHRIRRTRTQMGTLVTISVVHPNEAKAIESVTDVFVEMERLEGILSRHREETPISRLNKYGRLLEAPVDAVQVISKALEYSVLTNGAFDISINPLLNLYESSFAGTGMPPLKAQVNEALDVVGYQNILMDGNTIALKNRGMSITLDGIAKGYIVDRSVEVLRAAGFEHVLVDAGGDMGAVGGGFQQDSWAIAIQDPWHEHGSLGILHLRDRSIATSGDYVRYFTEDKRLHHIIDPRNGLSPERVSAVTILASKAVDADALSTAVLVMGPQEGLRLIEQTKYVEGVIVTKEREVIWSTGLSS